VNVDFVQDAFTVRVHGGGSGNHFLKGASMTPGMGDMGGATVYGTIIVSSETVYRRSPHPEDTGPMVDMKFRLGRNIGICGFLATVKMGCMGVLEVWSYCVHGYFFRHAVTTMHGRIAKYKIKKITTPFFQKKTKQPKCTKAC
jgi:hypothetical protein